MSDREDKILGMPSRARQVCRVAYTINNQQPVISTIIGDQPLFYMDYDFDIEDEEMFDAADFNILEGEIEKLKREIDSFDHFSQGFAQAEDQSLQDYLYDLDTISQPFEFDDSQKALDHLIETLSASRMAEAYLEFAKDHNVEIQYCREIEEAFYDRTEGKILIHPGLEFVDQILLAARELRRHWQHRQGALIHPMTFHPDNAVLVNRAQVSDLVVAMIRISWELQLSGYKEPWERIENSSLADMGRAFAREAFLDFRTLNNGQAAAAVFETWFLSERCRMEDRKLIKEMLADYQGYVFDLDQVDHMITPTLIGALGEMPYGKNYLAPHADIIISDPIFTDVRDRSNANFLWFIKFERSFRETEHELQTSDPVSAQGDRRPASQDTYGKTQGKKDVKAAFTSSAFAHSENELNQTAEIVHIFAEDGSTEEESPESGDKPGKDDAPLSSRKPKGRKNKKGQKSKTSADIVYLRRWSGE